MFYFENIEGGHAGTADLKQAAYRDALTKVYLIHQLMPENRLTKKAGSILFQANMGKKRANIGDTDDSATIQPESESRKTALAKQP